MAKTDFLDSRIYSEFYEPNENKLFESSFKQYQASWQFTQALDNNPKQKMTKDNYYTFTFLHSKIGRIYMLEEYSN